MNYTYEKEVSFDTNITRYNIFDPDGIEICSVATLYEAQALISHLNRE